MAREASVVRAVVERLNRIPGCRVRKRHGDQWGVAGDADVYGCYCGRHVELEVKPPGWRPRNERERARHQLQLRRLEEWRRAGAVAAVVTSADEAASVVLGIETPVDGQNPDGFDVKEWDRLTAEAEQVSVALSRRDWIRLAVFWRRKAEQVEHQRDRLEQNIEKVEHQRDGLLAEVDGLRAFKGGVVEALNAGDGAYRP